MGVSMRVARSHELVAQGRPAAVVARGHRHLGPSDHRRSLDAVDRAVLEVARENPDRRHPDGRRSGQPRTRRQHQPQAGAAAHARAPAATAQAKAAASGRATFRSPAPTSRIHQPRVPRPTRRPQDHAPPRRLPRPRKPGVSSKRERVAGFLDCATSRSEVRCLCSAARRTLGDGRGTPVDDGGAFRISSLNQDVG